MELIDSKALCMYEITLRHAEQFEIQAPKFELEEKRLAAVDLVGKLKECYTKFWPYLEDKQKERVSLLCKRFFGTF